MSRLGTEERLARILAMVPWVVAHDGPTVEETCQRFGCTPTELTADLELLFLCGVYPYTPDTLVEATIEDGRVSIQYAEYFSRPLRLTAAEALRLLASAETLLGTPGTDRDGPLARGLAKLAASLGVDDGALDISLGAAAPDVLAVLRDAVTAGEQVDIDYYALGRDERSQRTIEPAGVFSSNGQWYVSAWCHQARAGRLFRADRVLTATANGRPRTGPPVDPAPAVLTDADPAATVVLDLAPDAHWVAAQYPLAKREDRPDGTLRVTLVVTERAWLDRLVLRLGPSATVVVRPTGWEGPAAAARRVRSRYPARSQA